MDALKWTETDDRRPVARLVSVGDAAAILGISRSHAYRLVAAGDLPSVHLGRRVLVPLSAIEVLSA
jgi:excisionase family DNA binding protein